MLVAKKQENDTHNTPKQQDILCGVNLHMTCSSPRCTIRSHSLVCIKNHLFIVGIGTILNKELELIFRSDRSDHMCVYI